MLKRHLMTHYNMTPDQYRQKWGLAPDYPMVAPNYAEQRRTLAKSIGLGTSAASASRASNSLALAPAELVEAIRPFDKLRVSARRFSSSRPFDPPRRDA